MNSYLNSHKSTFLGSYLYRCFGNYKSMRRHNHLYNLLSKCLCNENNKNQSNHTNIRNCIP
ncbi:MAG: hypothetical protein J6B33_02545 [Prevotella sp.]|nr:hypothetical protein [Prevotella sp.]